MQDDCSKRRKGKRLLSINNECENTVTRSESQGLTIGCQLEALFRVMWSGKWSVISPNSLVDKIWDLVPDFRGFSQQDSHEALLAIEDALLQDMEKVVSKKKPFEKWIVDRKAI